MIFNNKQIAQLMRLESEHGVGFIEMINDYIKSRTTKSMLCRLLGLRFERLRYYLMVFGIEYPVIRVEYRHNGNGGISKHYHNGKSIKQWSKETGIKHKTILDRINRGWSVEKAVTTKTIKNTGQNRANLLTENAIKNRETLKGRFWNE